MNYIFISNVVFEYVYLYLVLPPFLDSSNLEKLSSCSILFIYLYKIIKKIKLDFIHNLFEYGTNYNS